MVKSLTLFNTILVLLCFGLLVALLNSITSQPHLDLVQRPPGASGQPSTETTKEVKAKEMTTPPQPLLAEFETIIARNPFKNPDGSAAEKQKNAQARPPAPVPSVPLPTLVGTIFVGKEAKAILKSRDRQDLYAVGERVGGGTLAKIEADRVVIDLGHRRAEVALKSAPKKIEPRQLAGLQTTPNSRSQATAGSTGQSKTSSPGEGVRDRTAKRTERLRRFMERFEQQRQGARSE